MKTLQRYCRKLYKLIKLNNFMKTINVTEQKKSKKLLIMK